MAAGTARGHDDGMTMIEVGDEKVHTYCAEPSGDCAGGLVLIHEIWGLADHVIDVADRFAAAGFLVLAPDLLSGVGITPETGGELQRLRSSSDAAERTLAQPRMREAMAPTHEPGYAQWAVASLSAAVDELAADSRVAGRIAVVGFCFGGTYAFALAAADDRVKAAVPFYGSPPPPEAVGEIHCPVLAFYGDQDERLMASLPDLERSMAGVGAQFTAKVYPAVGHAFFNDTIAGTYDAGVAQDAWHRTLAFLDATLEQSS